jgi:malonate decarboxylase beta subunit
LVGAFGLDKLQAEQARLTDRLRSFGTCRDAIDIWAAEGISHAETVPDLPADQFISLANKIGRTSRDAR